ncbi:MAG: hypothetical protein ACKO37_01340, partial [Vampirovibrionales bacterium]
PSQVNAHRKVYAPVERFGHEVCMPSCSEGKKGTSPADRASFLSAEMKPLGLSHDILREIHHVKQARPSLVRHATIPIEHWVAQFEGKDDQRMALHMLKHTQFLTLKNARVGMKELYDTMRHRYGLEPEKTVFTSLGAAKSGGMMTYLMRQASQLKESPYNPFSHLNVKNDSGPFIDYSQLLNPKQMEAMVQPDKHGGIKNLVILDDMLGNGTDFKEFLESPTIKQTLKMFPHVYYATLVANPDGVAAIKKAHPDMYNLTFVTADTLKRVNGSSPEHPAFTPEEHQKAIRWHNKYAHKIDPFKFTEKEQQKGRFLLTFDWNTPNNAPMPFYQSSKTFQALFPRKDGGKDEHHTQHQPTFRQLSLQG